MRIVGVDLAAEAPDTAAVVLQQGDTRSLAAEVHVGALHDDALVDLARGADKLGVDSPLGWPDGFVAAVGAHHRGERWPADPDRRPLRYRRTDLVVREEVGVWPLSVSTDRLGVTALRCARLQQRWALEAWGSPAPRDGSGPLVEVYPAGALRVWGLPHSGYKRPAGRPLRERIIEGLVAAAGSWLHTDEVMASCAASDHVLDALVSAIVALAATLHTTTPIPPDDRQLAVAEGWIHLPGDLGQLAGRIASA